jgi:hypothetical protein
MAEEKEQTLPEAIEEAAKIVAEQLPTDLIKRMMASKLNEALNSLGQSYGSENIESVVKKAILLKTDELMRTDYAPQVKEIADRLANEAMVIARRDIVAKVNR